MEANSLAIATLDDIIFEGRNKAYGAYELRQSYNRHVKRASFLATATVTGLLLLLYLGTRLPGGGSVVVENADDCTVVELQPEPVFEKNEMPGSPTAPKPPAVEPVTATVRNLVPRIVDNRVEVQEVMPDQSEFSQADPGLLTTAGEPASGAAGLPAAETATGLGSGSSAAPEPQPFDFVEQMPVYADGGVAGMMKFISQHLRYPNPALAQGLEGTVIVSFVVSATGDITQVKVLKEVGGGTGEEAARVVQKMPRWKAGIQNHRQVPVRMTLPIRFKIS